MIYYLIHCFFVKFQIVPPLSDIFTISSNTNLIDGNTDTFVASINDISSSTIFNYSISSILYGACVIFI